ncbi:hypothetical protein [Methanocalculus sp. MSAO_Arc2]|uniref:hypothetical protein n=1 Tax=Methanocalculus sp. MSAO_Arc2 TaxID=2293855 RepID=UPI003217774C
MHIYGLMHILCNYGEMGHYRKNPCEAISDLADTCQLFYFTCHPETVWDLTEALPGAVVMEKGR